MDMRQINYFLLVAEAESFSRGASRARIAQPALSRKVRQLEQELGVDLFVRHRRGVSLTEEGALFRDRLEGVVRQLDQLCDDVASRAAEPRGRVVIGMPPSMQSMLTADVAHQFSSAYPRVQMRISEGVSVSLREMVASGVADLAVITSLDPAQELNSVALCDERLYVIGPRKLDLQTDKPLPLARLASASLIMTTFPNGIRLLIEGALSAAGVPTTIRHEVNSVPLIVELVRRGHGYAVLPFSAIHTHVAAKQISAAPFSDIRVTWVIANAKQRPLSSSARRLRDLIVETTADQIERGRWTSARLPA